MYQVIELYGDFEPWWFLEDWKDDIIDQWDFENLQEAKQKYFELWQKRRQEFPQFESRPEFLATFWEPKELRWCEECGEALQQYHSLMLLDNDSILNQSLHCKELSVANSQSKSPVACAVKDNESSGNIECY